MTRPTLPRTAPGTPLAGARRRVAAPAAGRLVTAEPASSADLPRVLRATAPGLDLAQWLRQNHDEVHRHLWERGAVLFRGFPVADAEGLEQLVTALSPATLDYVYGSTPRSRESAGVYTSTEYPADQTIPQHSEMAYASTWPMKLWFLCTVAAAEGGATPLADNRKVFARLDPGLRDRFIENGVMYVRNYGAGLDLPWQRVFETTDRAEVERFCRVAGIEYRWLDEDRLRTRQVCQVTVRHPQTGEWAWFNQAHLFHPTNLGPEVRESLLATFAEEDLPRNVLFGDGSPIPDQDLAEIRAAFEAETVAEPWQSGDVLLVDNILASHGRQPYAGPRKVLVSMAEPYGTTQGEK
ncbi:TauD/TfdA family dioxygenase [Streptomyces goshikiensis]|uniref:TauD/TfdA family dioxygenase n=1 Tax=Streptomyces TaxID=1883 RepID=UPI0018FE26DE|nr:TauD/TfdA family dioxygenase [Streptomyces sp. CB02120-2]